MFAGVVRKLFCCLFMPEDVALQWYKLFQNWVKLLPLKMYYNRVVRFSSLNPALVPCPLPFNLLIDERELIFFNQKL